MTFGLVYPRNSGQAVKLTLFAPYGGGGGGVGGGAFGNIIDRRHMAHHMITRA